MPLAIIPTTSVKDAVDELEWGPWLMGTRGAVISTFPNGTLASER